MIMNAKLPFLVAVVLCACIVAAAQYKSDLERANLLGPVKSVREISDISGPKSEKVILSSTINSGMRSGEK